ncbi:MAG: CHASE2 domain-containing protein [Cytophagales bacterium]
MKKLLIATCTLVILSSCEAQGSFEQDIALVNLSDLDRGKISEVINIINSKQPDVVAIDVQFYGREKPSDDYKLLLALEHCKNLVMISLIANYDGRKEKDYTEFTYGSMPEFLIGAKTGFANVILENDRSLRKFSIYEKVKGKIEYHFAIQVAMSFDSIKTMEFIRSKPRIVNVDYVAGKGLKVFSADDVLQERVSQNDIRGKIVMFGFLGPGDEDKFYTPLNENPNEPDMYGLEYLANIVAQVLESR